MGGGSFMWLLLLGQMDTEDSHDTIPVDDLGKGKDSNRLPLFEESHYIRPPSLDALNVT